MPAGTGYEWATRRRDATLLGATRPAEPPPRQGRLAALGRGPACRAPPRLAVPSQLRSSNAARTGIHVPPGPPSFGALAARPRSLRSLAGPDGTGGRLGG